MSGQTEEGHQSFEVSKTSQVTLAQNIYFSDADSPWSYEIRNERDSTYSLGEQMDANLGDFLSRPLKIASYQWTPGASLFETFNPWSLFFSNTKVKEKLNHFRNMRCNLNLKVMINGNSFYYGRILMSYNPYTLNDDVSRNRAFFIQDLIAASQRPHVLIDPCSSQGAEMVLPYLWHYNWFNLTDFTWKDNLGTVTLHDFDVLKHANGGNDPITINVFAWASEVELCIPTSYAAQSQPNNNKIQLNERGFPMVPQAKTKKGPPRTTKPKGKGNNASRNMSLESQSELATKDGLISKPATAIANAANMLSAIPMIAPYAKATSMVATKVGQIAKIFGYSRPQVMTDIHTYVPRLTGNLTNTDQSEAVQKLSVDSKNELTIDSRVVGLDGRDEMTLKSICSRESYLTQFDWAETKQSSELLFSIRCDPTAIDTLDVGLVSPEMHMTPLAFASLPFKWWTGSIKYRFQIVCSEFHRGRLRLVYEPATKQASDYNLNYSTIIDIANDRDFEYTVAWTQPEAWLEVNDPMGMSNDTYFSSAAALASTPMSNGALHVYVLNELATPAITPASVKVQVWISGGDDFCLAQPTAEESLQKVSVFAPQAVFEAQAEMQENMVTSLDSSNAPVSPDSVPSFATKGGDESTYLVYMGEKIASFRDLLKRYHFHSTYMINTDAVSAIGIRNYRIINFPAYRGYDPRGPHAAVKQLNFNESAPYNFCTETLMNYLAPAYLARRGSIRRKYVVNNMAPSTNLSVQRHDNPSQSGVQFLSTADPGINNGGFQRAHVTSGYVSGAGAALATTNGQSSLEVEFPYYSDRRFSPARDLQKNTGRDDYCHELAGLATSETDASQVAALTYVAAGEDFSLSFFVAAPVMFSYTDPAVFKPA